MEEHRKDHLFAQSGDNMVPVAWAGLARTAMAWIQRPKVLSPLSFQLTTRDTTLEPISLSLLRSSLKTLIAVVRPILAGSVKQGRQGLKSKVVGVVLGRKAQQLGNKVQREGRLILLIAIPLRIRQEWNHRCTKQEEVAEKEPFLQIKHKLKILYYIRP
jgi:hypothetical protein